MKEEFDRFEKQARAMYDDWGVKHGFRYIGRKDISHDCELYYDNGTTRLRFLYEFGALPILMLVNLSSDVSQPWGIEKESYDIGYLIQECCPDEQMDADNKMDEYDVKRVEGILQYYIQILEGFGLEILAGDFRMFEKFREKASKTKRFD